MKNIQRHARRLTRMLDRLEEITLASLLAFMTLLTFTQVVLRYVFNSGWVWSLEATTYAFAAMISIGMAYGVRTRSHIAVDLFINRLPYKTGRIVVLLALVLCLIYAGLMAYGSFTFVNRLYLLGHMARDIPLAKWALTAILPFGFCLLAYRLLQSVWHIVQGKDRPSVDERDENQS